MSGLSFSERVKLILQKRLDTTKWPLGDSGQGPGAIRYLTDGQGNAIAILTTRVDPNASEPIGPLGADQVDPIIRLGATMQLDVPHTFTKKTNSKEVILGAQIGTATNTRMTFHDQKTGSDYSVPSGKELLIYHEIGMATKVTASILINYGDDGVAEGTSAPTNEVFPAGFPSGTGLGIHFVTIDVVQELNWPVIIPADKFPLLVGLDTAQAISMVCMAVEYDA